jgi:hypothetical protein
MLPATISTPGLRDPIAFGDLWAGEEAERAKLAGRRRQLRDLTPPNKRSRTPEEEAELQEIEQKLSTDDVVDPLFKAIQSVIAPTVRDHKKGLFASQQTERFWQEIPNAVINKTPLSINDWGILIDRAGLKPVETAQREFAASIEAQRGNLPQALQLLDNVAGLFDKHVRLMGGTPRKPKDKLAALAQEIEQAPNAGQFGTRLGDAVRRGFLPQTELLVDWLLAIFNGVTPAGVPRSPQELTEDEKLLAGVYGILSADREEPPAYHLSTRTLPFDASTARRSQQFGKALFAAQGEYRTNKRLFDAVLPILVKIGEQGTQDEVKGIEWAQVIRYLLKRGIAATEPQLGRRVDEALNSIQNIGDDLPPSFIGIDLPDLEEEGTTDHEIVADNVIALQPAYFAAMFEELKVFQVVDKLVELFQNGILPIGKGNAGDSLFKYWKETATRVSEQERRSFYARTLGFVGGDDGGMPNREFNDLWMRFISAVSSFIRQNNVDDLLRTKIPGAISQQQVRKAGRDLAANLSLHGYGMAYFMATDLQRQVKDVIKLLSDPDIKSAYGARDMWQVIDQVATLELGGSKNSVRYRTMAASGAIIIAWLAKKSRELSSTSFGPVLDLDEIRNPGPRPSGSKPTTNPTDFDLVNACEQWLAVTGTQEEQVEDFAQPKEAPNMTSKPIQIPSIARDMLESVGVPAMSYGNGNGRN